MPQLKDYIEIIDPQALPQGAKKCLGRKETGDRNCREMEPMMISCLPPDSVRGSEVHLGRSICQKDGHAPMRISEGGMEDDWKKYAPVLQGQHAFKFSHYADLIKSCDRGARK